MFVLPLSVVPLIARPRPGRVLSPVCDPSRPAWPSSSPAASLSSAQHRIEPRSSIACASFVGSNPLLGLIIGYWLSGNQILNDRCALDLEPVKEHCVRALLGPGLRIQDPARELLLEDDVVEVPKDWLCIRFHLVLGQ